MSISKRLIRSLILYYNIVSKTINLKILMLHLEMEYKVKKRS